MIGRPITCVVYEPDGTLLTGGKCVSADPDRREVVMAELDQPGRVLGPCAPPLPARPGASRTLAGGHVRAMSVLLHHKR